MESSLDSTSPEQSVPVLKSLFKNRNFNGAFDVSMNESSTSEQVDKSVVSDVYTTTKSTNLMLFNRKRKPIQGLNVSAHESFLNSEDEQSGIFTKPKKVFSKKQAVDSFNVTFAESNSGSIAEESLFNESVLVKKSKPFRESNKRSDISIGIVESDQVNIDNYISFVDSDNENVDSTSFLTKSNPFRRSKKNVTDKLDTSRNDSVQSGKDCSSQLDADSSSWAMKKNPFVRRKSTDQNTYRVENLSHVSSVGEHSFENEKTPGSSRTQDFRQVSAVEECVFQDEQRRKSDFIEKDASNLSINVSKPQSESFVNESSINDENLNNWMSDQSEDEVPPPTVPTIPTLTRNSPLVHEILEKIPESEKSPSQQNLQNTTETENSSQRHNWEEKLNDIISKAKKRTFTKMPTPLKEKPKKITPAENKEKKYRPKFIKPAPFVTKRLYNFILKKFQPKYGVDAVLEAEDMISCICDTVKKVQRRKSYQKSLVQNLKKKMAKAELIETTVDFYEFVIGYLPYDFRVKVVPCLQPVTNAVYPPKDVVNPFDKIL